MWRKKSFVCCNITNTENKPRKTKTAFTVIPTIISDSLTNPPKGQRTVFGMWNHLFSPFQSHATPWLTSVTLQNLIGQSHLTGCIDTGLRGHMTNYIESLIIEDRSPKIMLSPINKNIRDLEMIWNKSIFVLLSAADLHQSPLKKKKGFLLLIENDRKLRYCRTFGI